LISDLVNNKYFCKNINLGYPAETDDSCVVYQKKKFIHKQEDERETKLSQMLRTFERSDFLKLVEKIEHSYHSLYHDDTIQLTQDESHWDPKIVEKFLSGDKVDRFKMKHGEQQLAAVHHLQQHNCLSKNCDYMEFGCGGASLSFIVRHSVHTIDPPQEEDTNLQQYILVDRMRCQKKADAKIMYDEDRNRKLAHVDRLTIDIAHLSFDKIPFKHDVDRLCVISKHLCGVATDLTLRCIAETRTENKPLRGIFIALCCHHGCSYKSYISKYYYLNIFLISRQIVI
jgi:hypothetical protein